VAAPTPHLCRQEGDTLSKVANKFGVELDALLAANPAIKDPNKISLARRSSSRRLRPVGRGDRQAFGLERPG
jgi:LysM repeat protein